MQWKTKRSQDSVPADNVLLSGKNIKKSPKELMKEDFAKQCGALRKYNKRLIIVMNANESAIDGPLKKMFE